MKHSQTRGRGSSPEPKLKKIPRWRKKGRGGVLKTREKKEARSIKIGKKDKSPVRKKKKQLNVVNIVRTHNKEGKD